MAFLILQRTHRPTSTAIETTLVPDRLPTRPSPLVSPAPAVTDIPLPAPNPLASPAPAAVVPSVPSAIAPATTPLGSLRVSNRTDHPIRVALLTQQAQTETTQDDPASPYDEPVHWDFAPQEGSTSGLILSLPEQTLQLHPGDVLVAFAQDGSRRYWGPYVVGETPAPLWQPSEAEWQLILTP
ncbi:hypothetical protein [Trichothermofontia sp.]